MIEIDKDKFKTYLNTKFVDKIRVDDIKNITINKMMYHRDQLSKDSIYYDVIKKNGFVELLMIKPIWSGWKLVTDYTNSAVPIPPQYVSKFAGTWGYRDNRTSNRFNFDSYQKWLIEVRDKKLESILEL